MGLAREIAFCAVVISQFVDNESFDLAGQQGDKLQVGKDSRVITPVMRFGVILPKINK